MSIKWKDFSEEEKIIIWQDTNSEISNFRRLTHDAASRKSKILTAGNAGGIITVITFIGTLKFNFSLLVAFSLLLFILGLLLNSIAIFLCEKRFSKYLTGYMDIRNRFAKYNSDMTQEEFDVEVRNLSIPDGAEVENLLELGSGILFLIGSIVIVVYTFLCVN